MEASPERLFLQQGRLSLLTSLILGGLYQAKNYAAAVVTAKVTNKRIHKLFENNLSSHIDLQIGANNEPFAEC